MMLGRMVNKMSLMYRLIRELGIFARCEDDIEIETRYALREIEPAGMWRRWERIPGGAKTLIIKINGGGREEALSRKERFLYALKERERREETK